jgi:micrococcal nuclease
MKSVILTFLLILFTTTAYSAPTTIQLREYKDRICYDGDTCYISISSLPKSLHKMSIRVLGIDTPEIRGKCKKEKELALKARVFANETFRAAKVIKFLDLKWDKYGGRILSNVYLDGYLYADMIINEGLARPYDGGKKDGWCD